MKPDLSKVPGGIELREQDVPPLDGSQHSSLQIIENGSNGLAFVIKNALSLNDCRMLRILFEAKAKIKSAPVSVAGFMAGDTMAAYGGVAGSTRTTMWSPSLAKNLWPIIAGFFGPRVMGPLTSTDWFQDGEHKHWLPVGCTPMMRFMRYDQGGEHYGHYDAGYFENDTHRTLMSFVIYLTTNDSGATRLLKDPQSNILTSERIFDDWTEASTDEQILHKVYPVEGSMFVFDHRMAHDVEKYTGSGPRIIIRGDIMFKKLDVSYERMQRHTEW